jgi:E3 ubiquitin-protein ligase HUWE1
MSALFGPPRQAESGPGHHPLLSNPAFLEDNQRQATTSIMASGMGENAASLAERMGPDAVRLVDGILRRHAAAGRQALSIGMSAASDGGVHLEIGGRRYTFPPPGQQNREDPHARFEPDISAEFVPRPTLQRWHDEMHICGEDSAKLVNHIINRLLPEAKKRAEVEAAKTKKEDEEATAAAEKAQEESRKAEEEKEKTAEEARKAEAATAAEVALPTSRVPTPPHDVEMAEPATVTDTSVLPTTSEPVPLSAETSSGSGEQPVAAPPAEDPSLARTLISIHGEDVDITGTGIDLEFLQALPDDMRADVVEQHMREHNRDRQAVPDAGATSQISPEFLNALPAEIRSEVMLQERMERTRRDAETQAPQAGGPTDRRENIRQRMRENRDLRELLGAAEGGDTGAGAGGLPGIFDMAGSGLRGGLLAEIGAGLADIVGGGPAALAGAGPRGPPPRPGLIFAGNAGDIVTRRLHPAVEPAHTHKRSKRDAVQLLDKPGVASLVRLLFFPEAFKRDYLQRVLVNLCENSSTRADLLNLLISVVQDGTGDLPAVDKSFSQMSLKPGTTPKATPKTPKAPETPAPAPSTSTSGLFAGLQSDHIPTFIAQRCFEALTHIVAANSQAINFFLTEHEQPVGLRKPISKKGKGKEKMVAQTKYPIVVLLGFLDRSVLLKAPGMMESFALLLSAITKPLVSMKANMEKADKDKKAEAQPETDITAIQIDTTDVPTSQTPRPIAATATPARPKAGEASTSTSSSGLTTAPAIPGSVLRLVVNCLTVGECSSRTFGYTLSIMQNLSAIPEAKETILDELRVRAQQLGQDILGELRELHVAVQDHTTEVGTASLSKFAPASSSQAQLLRLLKTIDYLHSEKVDSDPPGEVLTEQEKAIGQTFDTFDFESMWKELSACLTTVEARGSTDQIATVLLPLVEALMVICKYRRSETTRETRSPSVAPSSTGEADNIFVSFTTTHRKVLNAIVRTNPGLLSGSFSLLVRNPRVLEFDNKRNWFMQKLKRKRDQPAHTPALYLNLRRQYVFEDSFRALDRRTGNEVKYGKLSVKFHGEDGIDAGGVTREWYSVLAQQIFDPNFGEYISVGIAMGF